MNAQPQTPGKTLNLTTFWEQESALPTDDFKWTPNIDDTIVEYGKWSFYRDEGGRLCKFKTGDPRVEVEDGELIHDGRDAEQREAEEPTAEDYVLESLQALTPDWQSLFLTTDELLNAPPLTFAIENFLQEDGLNMIGGLSGHGKTLIALATVKALLEGGKLFNYFDVVKRSKRVVYLCPESSTGPLKERLQKFGLIPHVRSKKLFVRTLNVGENVKLTDPLLKQAVRGADVFLDTATRFMEGDENAAADQRVFADNLFALLRAGARTVTGLHHSAKAFRTASDITLENVLRGSGDLGAMLATCWGVLQMDEQTNRIHVKCAKARDFKPDGAFEIEGRPHIDETGYFKLTSRPGLTASLASQKQAGRGAQGGRPESLGEEDLRWAMEQRRAGVSDKAIAEELGVSRSTLNRQLGPRVAKPACG